MINIFSKLLILFLLCLLFTEQSYGQGILINEFMPDNKTSIQDEDDDNSDWIEIYNSNDYPVNLLNYSISDNKGDYQKWIFPDVTILPKSYLVIFASGKNRYNPLELHTNFKISSEGEQVFLSNNLGMIIDQTEIIVLEEDEVYERFPDGSSDWIKSINHSPRSANIANNQLIFSSNEGFYSSAFYLIIESLMADSVHYTLDGSIPTRNSDVFTDSLYLTNKSSATNYFSEIPTSPKQSLISYKEWESPDQSIDKVNILRCVSYRNGHQSSKIYTHSYFIDQSIFSKYNMPVISLVTEEDNLFHQDYGIYVPGVYFDQQDPQTTGNYFMDGKEWERPVHIEYFNSSGQRGFSQDAGMRIHGQKTRQAAQKSLKLYARDEYGKGSFDFRLFPQKLTTDYKRFLLQTTMASWRGSPIIADILAHEIVKDLNLEHQDSQPAVVYLNGEYWGIHTLRDRIDERFIAYTYGIDKDSVDLINGNFRLVEAGSNTHYIELVEFIEANDLSFDSNYEYVKSQIDVNSFIDYQIAEMFFSNKDWPTNNQKLWRPQTSDGKWRWILFDLDAGFGNYNSNMFNISLMKGVDLSWDNLPVSTYLLRNLLRNQDFVSQMVTRYSELLNTHFQSDAMIKKLNNIKEQYEDEIPRHISRWHYPNSYSEWERDIIAELSTFLEERPCAASKNISGHFGLNDFGYTCEQKDEISDSIILAPNPNNGTFYLHNNSNNNFLGYVVLSDITGSVIYLKDYIFLGVGEKEYFSMKQLSSGVYFMRLLSPAHIGVKPIVIIL